MKEQSFLPLVHLVSQVHRTASVEHPNLEAAKQALRDHRTANREIGTEIFNTRIRKMRNGTYTVYFSYETSCHLTLFPD